MYVNSLENVCALYINGASTRYIYAFLMYKMCFLHDEAI